MSDILQQLAASRRSGYPIGIYSVCSAHPWVIEAAVDQALADDSALLIEATCNQVNHRGGYTGMVPEDFVRMVEVIASRKGLEPARLIFGGDHLGPNPWQHEPSVLAMHEATAMVEAFVKAGFRKIHLDASMACADDRTPLTDELVARRAALLCETAERHALSVNPVYVIGTEVPIPGGATESLEHIAVTRREAAEETLRVHKRVFAELGLQDAWSRVIALVVQPGVEFNHDCVVDYDPTQTAALTDLLNQQPIVFEAHSTDYQKPESFRALVRDGFAILKVGPALTFAMREALFALEAIESELYPGAERSHLQAVLDRTMEEDPRYWSHHYHGDARLKHLLCRYSYSDRVRYYWNYPGVQQAVQRLCGNIDAARIPETLLSTWLPDQYAAIRSGKLRPIAKDIVLHRIRKALAPYALACAPPMQTADSTGHILAQH